jgi:excisionase family DNA binding protein
MIEDAGVLPSTLAEWLTTTRVSCRLECSNNHVRRLAAEGRLRSIRTPHGILVDPDSVDELLRARDAGSPATNEVA